MKLPKKKIIWIIEHCDTKGMYPFERAVTLANFLRDESVFLFVKTENQALIDKLAKTGLTIVLFDRFIELKKKIRELEPDLIVHDGKDTQLEQVEMIRPYCSTIVHFDDFGVGAQLVDCHIIALFGEPHEDSIPQELAGSYAFAVPPNLQQTAQEIYDAADCNIKGELPHIVIAYEDGDANNLTYRTLRHLTQLHIPLKISIAIDDDYKHDIDSLKMMALSRRNIELVQRPDALLHLMPKADLIICNANYTPYKVAAAGIPCITTAQHEQELNYTFAREMNGFIHIGLGRKMKQSILQNAVMELLLHESRRERAVRKQRALEILTNNDILKNLLLDLAYSRHNLAHM
ncbi:CMP-N-acetylneuraminic acid synthetase [Solibacillus sp. MA9]|uniref:CMP-N-acetylneuraminic acid synthetase n=1 Tax=Solibacillus palustris TaxID=2908203 RepID=A0ABS9U7X8_9BACL|nr:CMP-N-acetylneuraminic acid synthetase [Solibacillus sp. MA9]MCH7320429.1 CMP-N-acetylneuraminic acid synthetase [Solibacillus sp. MA9]